MAPRSVTHCFSLHFVHFTTELSKPGIIREVQSTNPFFFLIGYLLVIHATLLTVLRL